MNDDDDDGNGTPDKDDPPAEPGSAPVDDDLRPLVVSACPGLTGTVELRVIPAALNRLRFYQEPDRSGRLTLPPSPSWDAATLGEEPVTLWVEGYRPSAVATDVPLRLVYTGPNGTCEDKVRLTVVQADLDVDSNNDGTLDPDNSAAGTDDPLEADPALPGKILCVNDDDDNANGVPDKDESGVVVGEDDLAQGLLQLGQVTYGLGPSAPLKWRLTYPEAVVKVWRSSTHENPVPSGTPQDFPLADGYVEGLVPAEAELELAFVHGGRVIHRDQLKVTVVRVRLKELTWSGDKLRPISQDDGSGPYLPPHWQDSNGDGDADDLGDRNFPVAYTRNTVLHLSAILEFAPADVFVGEVVVQAQGQAGAGGPVYTFTSLASAGGNQIVVPPVVAANVPLANVVDYMNPLRLRWWVQAQWNQVPLQCAESRHRIYVTLGDPNPAPLYETVVHLACSNGIGQTTADGTVSSIWAAFTDREVRRKPIDGFNLADGHQLTYYADWTTGNWTTALLLATGDGQCGSWAKLFIDILGAHGINHSNEYTYLFSYDWQNPNLGFLVDDWLFAGTNGTSGHSSYPYLNIPATPFPSSSSYNWMLAEVNDQTGIPGQGTSNPASLFNNHQVVKINGVYYDPSYGLTFASLADIDDSGIAAHFLFDDNYPVNEATVGADLNQDGDMADILEEAVLLIKRNPGGNQLVEIANEYP